MTRKFGLIGYPLSHSFSPTYFENKFKAENIDGEYLAYELESLDELQRIVDIGVIGLNVTLPYKELIIDYLDEVDELALQVGAVNTIKVEGSRLIGFNSDIYGFQESITKLPHRIKGAKTLIMGTGGAARAVQFVMERLGSKCTKVSRSLKTGADITYPTFRIDSLKEYSILINTTPLGMYPEVDKTPAIPHWEITSKHLVYDLIYNPEKTLLLKQAEERGARIKNGYEMLVLQAEKSWEIWNTR